MKKIFNILIFLLLTLNLGAQDFYRYETLRLPTKGFDELAPIPYKDGIIFVLGRPASASRKLTTESGKPMTDIYYAEKKGERSWGTPELLSNSLKTPFMDGPLTITADESLICFSRMYRAESRDKNNTNLKLLFADFENDEWVNIREFEHNDPEYTITTPFLSPDGKTLYFAADFESSLGGFDIYVSRFKNNSWSTPVNMGDKINSSSNDLFPFLHVSGKLYFSSQGHGSRGDYDIFYCDNFMGDWLDARPLERFNSRADDYSLVMSEDYTEGYFTRRGGSWDIYRFFTDYPKIENPRPIQRNRWKYRLKENSLDTIDYSMFEYEWVINDTLHIPGHEVIFQFPKQGDYYLSFNVHNKVTDTTEYDVGNLFLPIRRIEQPVFVCQDTVKVNEVMNFNARDTYLPNFPIEGYYWDFGDGMKDKGKTASHQYTSPGIKEVVLIIKEDVRKEPDNKAVFKEITVLPAD